jgi:hypothetical protein
MKIVAGTISTQGCGILNANSNRMELYRHILQMSHKKSCDVVCLPGGYLTTQSERERDDLAKTLVGEAEKYGIAIAIGIDLNDTFAFAISWSPAVGSTWHIWEQRSSTSNNWKTELNSKRETYREKRTLTVAEGAIEVLICGEIFNPVIRNNIVERKDCLTAIVDIAHTSGGGFNRAAKTMMKLANESGLETLLSIHAKSRNKPKRPTGIVSTDMIIEGPTWAELKIWDVVS